MCCTLILVGTAVSCVYTVLEYQPACVVPLILVGTGRTAVSCVYTVLEYQVHCTVLEYGMYTVPRYRTKFSTWYLVRPYLDLENCTKFSTVFLVTTKESVHKN